jgi:hypothetical protein
MSNPQPPTAKLSARPTSLFMNSFKDRKTNSADYTGECAYDRLEDYSSARTLKRDKKMKWKKDDVEQ